MKPIDKKQLNQYLENIARKEGITPKEVYTQIVLAVSFAIKKCPSETQNYWKNIPCEGDFPTVEELIGYLAKLLSDTAE